MGFRATINFRKFKVPFSNYKKPWIINRADNQATPKIVDRYLKYAMKTVFIWIWNNLVPRVYSAFKMAAERRPWHTALWYPRWLVWRYRHSYISRDWPKLSSLRNDLLGQLYLSFPLQSETKHCSCCFNYSRQLKVELKLMFDRKLTWNSSRLNVNRWNEGDGSALFGRQSFNLWHDS